jgi:hypothetical protein
MRSPLAANMRDTVADEALDTVIARGTYQSQVVTNDKQLRSIADKNVPVHNGMHDPNANSAKVPAKLGASDGQPIRKP